MLRFNRMESILFNFICHISFPLILKKIFHLGFPLCNAKTKLQHAVVALLWLLWSCQNSLKVNIYVTKSGPKNTLLIFLFLFLARLPPF